MAWLVSWLTFYPALMEYDSFYQWGQIVSFKFDDWHPAFHTLTEWLLTRIWFSPAVVALAQLVGLSLALAFLISRFEKLGVPRWLLWVTSGVVALSPVNGSMSIFLMKDVAYAACVIWLIALGIEAIHTEGRWLLMWRHALLLGLVAALIALFRHNGIPVGLGTIALLGLVYRSSWKQVCTAAAITVAVFLAISGPLYSHLNVQLQPYLFWEQRAVHQVAAVVSAGTPLTQHEAALMDQVLPLPKWKKLYDPYTADPLTDDDQFDASAIENNIGQWKQIWFSLIQRNPQAFLKHELVVSSLVWSIFEPENEDADGIYCIELSMQPDSNTWHLARSSKLPILYPLLYRYVDSSTHPKYVWFLWRPALYLFASVIFTVLLAIRLRSAKWLLLFAPAFLNAATIMAANVAQDFRYLYPNYLAGLISISLVSVRRTTGRPCPVGVHDPQDAADLLPAPP